MKPILQALLLCDRVYQDRSGKYIIVGVFDQWFFKPRVEVSSNDQSQPPQEQIRTPAEIQDVGTPWVYLSLTDLKGPTKLELRFENLTGAEVYFAVIFEVSSPDPLLSVQIGMPVPKLPSKAGDYILELLHDDVSLGAHRVKISEIKNAND
jgi:hypothetical protein